jgi:multidrug resistance efflux pump
MPKPASNKTDIERLEAQIAELENQLKAADMKVRYYAKMIDLAEEQFNITIRIQDDIE